MSNLEKHPPPLPLPRKIPTVAVIVPGDTPELMVTQDQELARGQQLAQNTIMAGENSLRRRWTEEDTILALYLYFQLPYGKLHSGNPEIRELSEALDRPSNSIKMKLCKSPSSKVVE